MCRIDPAEAVVAQCDGCRQVKTLAIGFTCGVLCCGNGTCTDCLIAMDAKNRGDTAA